MKELSELGYLKVNLERLENKTFFKNNLHSALKSVNKLIKDTSKFIVFETVEGSIIKMRIITLARCQNIRAVKNQLDQTINQVTILLDDYIKKASEASTK